MLALPRPHRLDRRGAGRHQGGEGRGQAEREVNCVGRGLTGGAAEEGMVRRVGVIDGPGRIRSGV